MRRSILAATVAAACACGTGRDFESARRREDARRFPEAADGYARFAARRPADPRAPEALYRAGRIFAYAFERCPEAKPLFERAAREYPSSPWAEKARQALLDCPEFFPIRGGMKWELVDSQTGGKNMRLELAVRASSSTAAGRIQGSYYAGKQRFQGFDRRYVKENWAVWELEGNDRVPILRYPYSPGTRWTAKRGGRPVEFSIESDVERVKTRAGTFEGCLKVREAERRAPAWKYDYYAPGVGRVKTTIGGKGFENPNTELKGVSRPASSDLPPMPSS